MKLARTGIIATAVLAVATLAFAQAKTDFSGSWAPEVDPAAAAPAGGGGGRGGGGGPMAVKQTATELSIERQTQNGAITQVYKLDGSESKNLDGSDGSDRNGEVGRPEARHHHQVGAWRADPDVVAGQRRSHHRSHRRPWAELDEVQEDHLVNRAVRLCESQDRRATGGEARDVVPGLFLFVRSVRLQADPLKSG